MMAAESLLGLTGHLAPPDTQTSFNLFAFDLHPGNQNESPAATKCRH
jgi:hypothetical protein